MNLYANNFPESGLGDRLCEIAMLSLYADLKGYESVYTCWVNYNLSLAHESVPKWRVEDTRLKNLQQHVKLPTNVRFALPPQGCDTFPFPLGKGRVDLQDFCATWMGGSCKPENIKTEVNHVRSRFAFTNVDSFNLPYVGVHVRRTDKIRPAKVCDYIVPENRLEELNNNTRAQIDKAIQNNQTNFFLCTDDDQSLLTFIKHIHLAGGTVLSFPIANKWKSTYSDLACLSRANLILQSCDSSAFSNFAAFLGGCPIINCLNIKNTS